MDNAVLIIIIQGIVTITVAAIAAALGKGRLDRQSAQIADMEKNQDSTLKVMHGMEQEVGVLRDVISGLKSQTDVMERAANLSHKQVATLTALHERDIAISRKEAEDESAARWAQHMQEEVYPEIERLMKEKTALSEKFHGEKLTTTLELEDLKYKHEELFKAAYLLMVLQDPANNYKEVRTVLPLNFKSLVEAINDTDEETLTNLRTQIRAAVKKSLDNWLNLGT